MRAKREEMLLSLGVLLTLTIVFATLACTTSRATRSPISSPTFPHALWWAVVTITTVGYGDIAPSPRWASWSESATALLGILMIALPTGVFGAAFVEELNNRRKPNAQPVAARIAANRSSRFFRPSTESSSIRSPDPLHRR
jgi:voltage-gated potassium channel